MTPNKNLPIFILNLKNYLDSMFYRKPLRIQQKCIEIRRLCISKLRIFFYARPSRCVLALLNLNNGRLRKVRLFLGTSEIGRAHV